MKNLSCCKAEEWIVADLDAGLEHKERLALEHHLSECSACKRMRDETQSLLSDVAAVAPEDPGEVFWRHYRVSLDARLREHEVPRAWSFWWKPASAFAVAVLVFVVVFIGFFHMRGFQPSTDVASSSELIGDLNQLYGPVRDELAYLALDAEDTEVSQFSRLSALDESFLEWFEVEDEPNQFFL